VDVTFFSAVQKWVKGTLGTDYGGRYLGQVLKQVSRIDPRPFRQLFAHITRDRRLLVGRFRIEAEEEFALGTRRRRADLVVYANDVPKIFVELKYRDRLAPPTIEKTSQLADYLYACRRMEGRPKFLLLHREVQDTADIAAIRKAKQYVAHYGQMVPFLQRSNSPVTKLLLDYLREEGMVIDPIDTEYLYRFLHRLVLPPGGSGRINRTSDIERGPIQFQRLLSNLRLVASEITPHLRAAARTEAIRNATIDFDVLNAFDSSRLATLASEATGRLVDVSARYRKGGIVDVWAQNALINSGSWLYVMYGFEFHLQVGKPLEVDAYAYLESPEIRRATNDNVWDERFMAYETLSTRTLRSWRKGNLEPIFTRFIRQAARSALRAKSVKNRRAVSILRRLAE